MTTSPKLPIEAQVSAGIDDAIALAAFKNEQQVVEQAKSMIEALDERSVDL